MLLKNKIVLLLLFVTTTFSSFSQETKVYNDKYKNYRDGLELYDKQKFSAAQEKFHQVISSINDENDEIQVDAEYLRAVCALNLFNQDAQYLLSQFALEHPDSPKTKKIFFLLGNDFYRRKKFKDAIEWFEKVDKYNLDENEVVEYYFKLGYSYFNRDQFAEAKKCFYEIKEIESDYYGPSQYYYAHLSYEDSNYQTALEGFRKIENDPGFSPIVPYYISQILFKQQKYKEVIQYAPAILEKDDVKREYEIKGIIGSSYFKLDNFKNAIPFLEDYFKKTASRTTDDYYQLGFSNYKEKDYDNTIKYLGRVAAKEDERAQICNYLLAESYIKIDKKEYAKVAFKRAYDLGFDKSINEDALFGYAKSTYELSYNPYDEATETFHKFLEEFPKSSKKELVYEYLLDVYTTTKNYKEALSSLNRIKDKNFELKEAYQKLSFNRAVELFYKGEYTEALTYFSDVKKYNINPQYGSKSVFWIAETKYRQKQYDEAIVAYTRYKSEPGAISGELIKMVDYNIGYAYFQQEKYDNAITAFRNFIKSTNDKVKKGDANLRVGDAYYLAKNDYEAVKYYQNAIDLNQKSVDYALYQKAICSGYLDDYEEKERLLTVLLRNYENSIYAKNTLYELANTYRIQNKNEEALKYYQQIANQDADNNQKRMALLNIGGIYVRQENYKLAENQFSDLVKKYPGTTESEAAIDELEKVYLLQNKIDEFPDLLASLGVKYSESKLDSTLWYPANQAYLDADCVNATKGLKAYLDKISTPKYEVAAHFYLGECSYINKEYEKALRYYEFVMNKKQDHLEDALFHAANISYRLDEMQEANKCFKLLEPLNTDQIRIPIMNRGLMRTSFTLNNYEDAIKYASKVLSDEQISKNLEEEAYMIKANANFKLTEYANALPLFKHVVSISNDIDKSIAKYRICQIYYIKKDYKKSEDELFELIKQKPTYDYWLAKGFILLSDVYIQKKDNFQAKATLKSVIDNYVGDDDIMDIANTKLAAIIEAEKQTDNKLEEELEINNPE
jgi:tetratricopeptide (TPR) repeat protein